MNILEKITERTKERIEEEKENSSIRRGSKAGGRKRN